MATQTLENMEAENKKFYAKTLLTRLLPKLIFTEVVDKKDLPDHEGDKISFRRFESLEDNDDAILEEGVTPNGTGTSVTEVVATLEQHGDFSIVSDKLCRRGIDPVITEYCALHGERGAKILNRRVRNEMRTGTQVMRPNGRATTDAVLATDKITCDLILDAVTQLRDNDVEPFDDGYYRGLIDAKTAKDIMKDPDWKELITHTGGEEMKKGEVGCIHGVKFKESSLSYSAMNSASTPVKVHHSLIVGKHAVGAVDPDGLKPEIIIKYGEDSGTEDPLNQRNSVGWKADFVAKRLNEKCLIRIEAAATE